MRGAVRCSLRCMGTSEVSEAVFSRDGRYILTVGNDEAVMLWEAQDGVLVDVLASGQGIDPRDL